MHVTPLHCGFPEVTVDLAHLERWAADWVEETRYKRRSRQTQELKSLILRKFVWFLRERGAAGCGRTEIVAFLNYVTDSHATEGGRWGNPRLTAPARPQTVRTYYAHLKVFFRDLVKAGRLPASPMESIDPPKFQVDEIKPFTDEQIRRLLLAARRSRHPNRDEAILLVLLDTGLRASELCALKYADFDASARSLTVLGKGEKRRTVHLGDEAFARLWAYLWEDFEQTPSRNRRSDRRQGRAGSISEAGSDRSCRRPSEPLFRSDRGTHGGRALSRSGLQQLMERLAVEAGLGPSGEGEADGSPVRCSPHTWRHTFAISFLRNGGNMFALQKMLGHTNLAMTRRYLAISEADVETQHSLYSPADAFRARHGRGR